MCEPARFMVTSSASIPLMRSTSSTAFLIASTAASGFTITPLRSPRASASPMPTISSKPPSPGSPAIHVTRLVPMSRPIVCGVRLPIYRLLLIDRTLSRIIVLAERAWVFLLRLFQPDADLIRLPSWCLSGVVHPTADSYVRGEHSPRQLLVPPRCYFLTQRCR